MIWRHKQPICGDADCDIEINTENRSLTLKTIRKMDSTYLILDELIGMLPIILCGCVLPIMVVWFVVRKKINETNARTQIVTAAIEKNPDLDVEDLLKKASPKPKLLKEKLLTKLLWGCLAGFLGLGFLGIAMWLGFVGGSHPTDITVAALTGAVLLGIGIAFLINYALGKKMLAKEIQAEEKMLMAQAERK